MEGVTRYALGLPVAVTAAAFLATPSVQMAPPAMVSVCDLLYQKMTTNNFECVSVCLQISMSVARPTEGVSTSVRILQAPTSVGVDLGMSLRSIEWPAEVCTVNGNQKSSINDCAPLQMLTSVQRVLMTVSRSASTHQVPSPAPVALATRHLAMARAVLVGPSLVC